MSEYILFSSYANFIWLKRVDTSTLKLLVILSVSPFILHCCAYWCCDWNPCSPTPFFLTKVIHRHCSCICDLPIFYTFGQRCRLLFVSFRFKVKLNWSSAALDFETMAECSCPRSDSDVTNSDSGSNPLSQMRRERFTIEKPHMQRVTSVCC